MYNKRIYLSSPTMHLYEEEYVKEAFKSNWVAPLGPNVDGFEKDVRDYVGAGDVVALSSGTAALHLAVKLAGVSQGDIVFCSSLTFSASANTVVYENAKPVFIDSEEESWNMAPRALEKAIEKYPNAKAAIVVDLYGVPAKLDEISDICKKNNIVLIEDAAESLGATFKNKQTGTFGDYGIFSFNGNKIITTSGGGMLVSNRKEDMEKARFLATQARDKARHYQHSEIGYNYRMSNVLAGIGRGQMLSLNNHIELKKKIYFRYKEAFEDIKEIEMNPIPHDCEPIYWLSCITIDEKSKVKPLDIMAALEEENIESRPIWKPMHLQPVFEECDFIKVKEKPVSEDIFNRGVCLPSDIKNTDEDMRRIINIIRKLFGR